MNDGGLGEEYMTPRDTEQRVSPLLEYIYEVGVCLGNGNVNFPLSHPIDRGGGRPWLTFSPSKKKR